MTFCAARKYLPCSVAFGNEIPAAYLGQRFVIREVEAQRGQRDIALMESCQVGPVRVVLDPRDREPVKGSLHRILARYDAPVVLVDGLSRPADSAWLTREVHVHQRRALVVEQQLEHLLDPWLECSVIGIVVAHGRAHGDAANPEKRSLLRGSKRA